MNKDNPIKCLSLSQVDAIFSKSRRRGAKEDVTTWGQLGLTGEWATRPISLYGRNSASGTYGFFKEHSLENGDFKDSVKEQPGLRLGGAGDPRRSGSPSVTAASGTRPPACARCRSPRRTAAVRRGHRRELLQRQAIRSRGSCTCTSIGAPASRSIR